jgi:hypothetical protein
MYVAVKDRQNSSWQLQLRTVILCVITSLTGETDGKIEGGWKVYTVEAEEPIAAGAYSRPYDWTVHCFTTSQTIKPPQNFIASWSNVKSLNCAHSRRKAM